MDGVLLLDDAVDGARAGEGGSDLRRHGLEVLRALRRHRRCDERAGRHGPVGRGGRVLLRPALDRRTRAADADPIDGRPAAVVRRRSARSADDRRPARLQEAARLVPRQSSGSRPAHHLHGASPHHGGPRRLLAIPSRERLERVLRYMLDEREFLSPFGIRSRVAHSRVASVHPPVQRRRASPRLLSWRIDDSAVRRKLELARTDLAAAELSCSWKRSSAITTSTANAFTVECPTGSGRHLTLEQVAREISRRVASIFLRDESGRRPCYGHDSRHASDPHWRDLMLFHEYFHAETGRGCGASHQTGWTALAARFIAERSGPL